MRLGHRGEDRLEVEGTERDLAAVLDDAAERALVAALDVADPGEAVERDRRQTDAGDAVGVAGRAPGAADGGGGIAAVVEADLTVEHDRGCVGKHAAGVEAPGRVVGQEVIAPVRAVPALAVAADHELDVDEEIGALALAAEHLVQAEVAALVVENGGRVELDIGCVVVVGREQELGFGPVEEVAAFHAPHAVFPDQRPVGAVDPHLAVDRPEGADRVPHDVGAVGHRKRVAPGGLDPAIASRLPADRVLARERWGLARAAVQRVDHRAAGLLGPPDAVGRERGSQPGVFALGLAEPVVEDHLVAAARIRIARIDHDGVRVAVAEAAVADHDDVGVADAVEVEQAEVRLDPADAVVGLGIADEGIVGL